MVISVFIFIQGYTFPDRIRYTPKDIRRRTPIPPITLLINAPRITITTKEM